MVLEKCIYQAAKTRALYESTNEPAGQPANNPPNSDGLWISIERILSWLLGSVDDLDGHFANSSVLTRTNTWNDCPKRLLTVAPSSSAWRELATLCAISVTRYSPHYLPSGLATWNCSILELCVSAKSPIGTSWAQMLAMLFQYRLFASLDACRVYRAASILSPLNPRCLVQTARSDPTSWSHWVQLAACPVTFSSSIRSTASWHSVRQMGQC